MSTENLNPELPVAPCGNQHSYWGGEDCTHLVDANFFTFLCAVFFSKNRTIIEHTMSSTRLIRPLLTFFVFVSSFGASYSLTAMNVRHGYRLEALAKHPRLTARQVWVLCNSRIVARQVIAVRPELLNRPDVVKRFISDSEQSREWLAQRSNLNFNTCSQLLDAGGMRVMAALSISPTIPADIADRLYREGDAKMRQNLLMYSQNISIDTLMTADTLNQEEDILITARLEAKAEEAEAWVAENYPEFTAVPYTWVREMLIAKTDMMKLAVPA